MGQGYSFESFAGRPDVRVDKATLYNWRNAHKKFFEAYKKGEMASLHFLETAAIDGATNPIKNPVNTGLLCFLIKNRLGWKDRIDNVIEADSKRVIKLNYKVDNENDQE